MKCIGTAAADCRQGLILQCRWPGAGDDVITNSRSALHTSNTASYSSVTNLQWLLRSIKKNFEELADCSHWTSEHGLTRGHAIFALPPAFSTFEETIAADVRIQKKEWYQGWQFCGSRCSTNTVAQMSVDTKGKTLNVECQGMSAILCA
jgi:hypothetical protein